MGIARAGTRVHPTLYMTVGWSTRALRFVTRGDSTLLRLCDGEIGGPTPGWVIASGVLTP